MTPPARAGAVRAAQVIRKRDAGQVGGQVRETEAAWALRVLHLLEQPGRLRYRRAGQCRHRRERTKCRTRSLRPWIVGAPITDSRRSRSSVVSRFGSKSRVRLLESKASLSTTATASPRAKALCRCASGSSSAPRRPANVHLGQLISSNAHCASLVGSRARQSGGCDPRRRPPHRAPAVPRR